MFLSARRISDQGIYRPAERLSRYGLVADDTLRVLNQEKRGRNHRFSDEALLEIKTRIAALEGVGVDPKDVTLKLLDTPGPNEAGEEALK